MLASRQICFNTGDDAFFSPQKNYHTKRDENVSKNPERTLKKVKKELIVNDIYRNSRLISFSTNCHYTNDEAFFYISKVLIFPDHTKYKSISQITREAITEIYYKSCIVKERVMPITRVNMLPVCVPIGKLFLNTAQLGLIHYVYFLRIGKKNIKIEERKSALKDFEKSTKQLDREFEARFKELISEGKRIRKEFNRACIMLQYEKALDVYNALKKVNSSEGLPVFKDEAFEIVWEYFDIKKDFQVKL